jgi:hypothetical protein
LFHLVKATPISEVIDTAVTDAGLAQIKDFEMLTRLSLERTDVTANGLSDLKKALPKCAITWSAPHRKPKDRE